MYFSKTNAQLKMIILSSFQSSILFIVIGKVYFNNIAKEEKYLIYTFFSMAIILQFIRIAFSLQWGKISNPFLTNNNISIISILFLVINLLIISSLFLLVIQRTLFNQEKLINRLEIESITDELTNLINRRGFLSIIDYEQQKDLRYNKKSYFSIAMCDIDYFKNINDTYGHNGGDFILKSLSTIFKNNIRSTDIVARWGGEEFIFYFPNTNKKEAISVLKNIKDQIENENYLFNNFTIKTTVSFGGVSSKITENLDSIISSADKNLYKSKANGRNKITFNTI